MTSPPARVDRACQTPLGGTAGEFGQPLAPVYAAVRPLLTMQRGFHDWMLFLMNRTEPSQNRALIPPGCRLLKVFSRLPCSLNLFGIAPAAATLLKKFGGNSVEAVVSPPAPECQ